MLCNLKCESADWLKPFVVNQYIQLISELEQLTGVAAILRFPMPELEDESDGSDSEGDE